MILTKKQNIVVASITIKEQWPVINVLRIFIFDQPILSNLLFLTIKTLHILRSSIVFIFLVKCKKLTFYNCSSFFNQLLSEGSTCYKNVTKREICRTQPFHASITITLNRPEKTKQILKTEQTFKRNPEHIIKRSFAIHK